MSIKDQLKYRFIISVEGNDVTSGLKWQLYSNSIILMYKHNWGWLMEFRLKPYYHYVPIKKILVILFHKLDGVIIMWKNAIKL